MTKEQALEWFLNGFEVSGEGFNNEWPFQHHDPERVKKAQKSLEDEFELYWAAYEKDKNDRH
jgi:hypothetical protein